MSTRVTRGRFVGRVAELAALERQHRRDGAVLLPVYGRRRIGKSELLMSAFPAGKRQIVVLDEFQWLCESAPELPSVLQKLWDHRWQHERRPFIVLCGSYIGFME